LTFVQIIEITTARRPGPGVGGGTVWGDGFGAKVAGRYCSPGGWEGRRVRRAGHRLH
jgi:hypothetical protein